MCANQRDRFDVVFQLGINVWEVHTSNFKDIPTKHILREKSMFRGEGAPECQFLECLCAVNKVSI